MTATTAPTTAFCAERIDGPGGLHLWIDGNGKITASQGSLDAPKPNAFSIVQVEDCPFRTPSCEASCYVHELETHAKSTHDLYRHNSETIRKILDEPDLAVWMYDWSYRLACWIEENCIEFRWHVSGDIFSREYAEFIQLVCGYSPTVQHWIYTRSFPYVEALLPARGNLAINLSADRDNYWLARRYADQHDLRVCYMTTDGTVPSDLKPGDVIFPDYGLRGSRLDSPSVARDTSAWWQGLTGEQRRMVCPVDFYGKSEGNRCGPCRKCMK